MWDLKFGRFSLLNIKTGWALWCSKDQIDNCELMYSCLLLLIWTLLYLNTQPVLIFSRVVIFHLERLVKVTWFHNFEILCIRSPCLQRMSFTACLRTNQTLFKTWSAPAQCGAGSAVRKVSSKASIETSQEFFQCWLLGFELNSTNKADYLRYRTLFPYKPGPISNFFRHTLISRIQNLGLF